MQAYTEREGGREGGGGGGRERERDERRERERERERLLTYAVKFDRETDHVHD
jgi:hypothetical protein